MAKSSKAKTQSQTSRDGSRNSKGGGLASPARSAQLLAEKNGEALPEIEPQDPAWSEDDPRFWQVALVLMVVGIGLRQWQLQAFPYHPDEGIHAWFAWGFNTYHYNPTYHGPLLYHLEVLVFTILGRGNIANGANDYSARLVSSLLGVGLMAIVLGPARRWLGGRGALWSLALVTFSPVIVTYSRRILHDSLVMVLTLGAVLCFQRARELPGWTKQGRIARIGLMTLLALFVATKANAFFVIAMLLSFWMATQVRALLMKAELGRRIAEWTNRLGWLPPVLLVLAAFGSYLGLRPLEELVLQANIAHDGRPQVFHDFLATLRSEKMFLLVCLGSCFLLWLLLCLAPNDVPATEVVTAGMGADDEPNPRGWQLKAGLLTSVLATVAALFCFAMLYGLWWRVPVAMWQNAHPVATAAAAPNVPNPNDWHLVAKTSWLDTIQALPKMFAYWGGQQKAPRLPGPHDYYLVLLALYELPIFVLGICGFVRASRVRSAWTDLLMWWAFTSFVAYAIANEKVPWLMCHIILPFALLGGWWLGQQRFETDVKRTALIFATVLSLIFLGRNISATNFERAADHHEPMFYAQITEKVRDNLFDGLARTQGQTSPIWVHPDMMWPSAWYLRDGSPSLGGSSVDWSAVSVAPTLRLAIAPPDKLTGRDYRNWTQQQAEYYIWPRAGWNALRPDLYWNFWLKRETPNKLDPKTGHADDNSFLNEWSNTFATVATPG